MTFALFLGDPVPRGRFCRLVRVFPSPCHEVRHVVAREGIPDTRFARFITGDTHALMKDLSPRAVGMDFLVPAFRVSQVFRDGKKLGVNIIELFISDLDADLAELEHVLREVAFSLGLQCLQRKPDQIDEPLPVAPKTFVFVDRVKLRI